ncbi:MAG: hotdog domain-containing protein, partial [Anaerovoracaceae bacterium]
YPYSRMAQEGLWLPVAAVECEYKKPARYDDVLVIRSWVEKLKAATIIMGYEIINKETGETCVKGTSKHAITTPKLVPVSLKKHNPELYALILAAMEKPRTRVTAPAEN